MALPTWPGASVVYLRAEIIAAHLCATAYRAQRARYTRKTGFRFTPPCEADVIISAMNQGDEEALKGYAIQYESLWI